MTSTHTYETSTAPNLNVLYNLTVGGTTTLEGATKLRRNVVQKTAAFNPTAAESGSTYILKAAAGAAILLPTPSSGLQYKFIVGQAFATSSWTITSTSNGTDAANLIYGHCTTKDVDGTASDGAATAGTAVDVITFVNSAEQIGDWIEVICDGTNWFAFGSSEAAAGITLA